MGLDALIDSVSCKFWAEVLGRLRAQMVQVLIKGAKRYQQKGIEQGITVFHVMFGDVKFSLGLLGAFPIFAALKPPSVLLSECHTYPRNQLKKLCWLSDSKMNNFFYLNSLSISFTNGGWGYKFHTIFQNVYWGRGGGTN